MAVIAENYFFFAFFLVVFFLVVFLPDLHPQVLHILSSFHNSIVYKADNATSYKLYNNRHSLKKSMRNFPDSMICRKSQARKIQKLNLTTSKS